MPFFETPDQTSLYYRDWGTGTPVVFLSGVFFSGAMWEYQMVPLSEREVRCIALDRRGHGRSDDPGRGYDFDTLADDLAQLLTHLDLRDVTLVGYSMGGGEVARYLSRHGTDRIAHAVLISTITPFLLQTEDNPEGTPRSTIEQNIAAMRNDRPLFLTSGVTTFTGVGSFRPEVQSPMAQWGIQLCLECSPKAALGCTRTQGETDFRPDMHAFTVPTLIIHGDKDRATPLDLCGRRTAQAIPLSQINVYEGASHNLPFAHIDRLNDDLLAFIQG